jgi:two-component system CheB/CheR fusion protein
MAELAIREVDDYRDYLEVHPDEFVRLFNTLLINVTSFYRDRPSWDYLAQEIVPRVLAARGSTGAIRAWSAGCATGEEAYTLALILCDALGVDGFRERVKIYATDVDEEALAQARQASYSPKGMEPVPVEQRDSRFESPAGRYVFRPELRRSVIFGRHDLVNDAPISQLDLLVCRNTLMYLNSESQGRALARFSFALRDTGFLFLGRAEMLLSRASIFAPVNLKHRVFAKAPSAALRGRMLALSDAGLAETVPSYSRAHIQEAAFLAAPIAKLAVGIDGTVEAVNRRACEMMGLSPGDVGKPLADLEISSHPVELRPLVNQVYATHRPVHVPEVERVLRSGEIQYLDVDVVALTEEDGELLGVGIAFDDVTRHVRVKEDLQRSRMALGTANEELQSSNEELETTNEELQTTNEELETTNEELQSANEELETMNEEMQSTNAEIEAVNDELRERTEDLARSNVFLESTVASFRAGIVVVDRDLDVRLWSPGAADLWGLGADEVLGLAFFGLDMGLPLAALRESVIGCLAGTSPDNSVVVDAVNRRGASFRCRVRTMPLAGPGPGPRGIIMVMEAE